MDHDANRWLSESARAPRPLQAVRRRPDSVAPVTLGDVVGFLVASAVWAGILAIAATALGVIVWGAK